MMLSSPFVLVEYDTGILDQDTHCLMKQKQALVRGLVFFLLLLLLISLSQIKKKKGINSIGENLKPDLAK